MYLTDDLLAKLNTNRDSKSCVTWAEIMTYSFAELNAKAKNVLDWDEKNFLYQQAQKELKENKMANSRALTRANPQLANAVRLGIRQPPVQCCTDACSGHFVKPGSVASMFSPAAYLTTLYREAKGLHSEASLYHLDKRRPDLATIFLSQSNMDDELSTLSLSNEVLLEKIHKKEKGVNNDKGINNDECKNDGKGVNDDKGANYDRVIEMLATYRKTGTTPYNQPYETVRQSIILQDPEFAAFRNNPYVAAKMDTTSQLSIQMDISPELWKILTEKISEENVDDLIKKNFGDANTAAFQNVTFLANWYELSCDEMSLLLKGDAGGNHLQYDQNDQLSYRKYLLKLNKLIRLYKATGIAPSYICNIIESNNNKFEITSDVLNQLFRVNYYILRYGIDMPAALVLAGSAIGKAEHGNKGSTFARLFNMPKLNNTEFCADGTLVNLTPSETTDTFRTGVIKRALGIHDTELYTLWCLISGSATPPDFTCTIENLSALYRVSLLANIHNLSISELAALLSVSSYASKPIGSLSGEKLSTLVDFTDRYTGWLKEMNWTVRDLYLMLTERHSTTLSPDIENLIATLKSGLAGQDFSKTEKEDVAIIESAPFIAASTQLASTETAMAILQWLSQLKPQKLTVSGFLRLAISDDRTDNETYALVSYCQVMGQLALIARNTRLSSTELSWVVTHPAIITSNSTVLGHDIDTLYSLTRLHELLSRCGTHTAEILTSLSGKTGTEKKLSVKTVATAFGLDEHALTQALAQCSSGSYFYNLSELEGALQWLNVATIFGITPADVAKLVNLKADSKYDDWVAVSHILQAGLNSQQTIQLRDSLDETLGVVASGYVIKNIAPSWVTNRNQLYSWLLIDNQVSAQTKSTRIAEAIASIQLYINRALSGQEDGVNYATKSKKFFSTDWDTYNKHYSTWASVSQLAYYPENYIDPTLRVGQTGMMDEMLQTLSQSQLTSDTVEDAFKTYMTRFEDIANLDIISGYHDSLSDQDGTTWLVGKSAVGEYYWRSADIGKMFDGKLPANAWSEWKKVTVSLNPVNNLVRPVIFQSRLYLIWVETRETATIDINKTQKVTEYLLKYVHILHDGSWGAPVSIELKKKTLPLEEVNINDTGMYCAANVAQEKLYVYFYKKTDSYSKLPSDITGLCLYQNSTAENIPDNSIANMESYIHLQFDTTSAVRLNTPYTGERTQIVVSDAKRTGYTWGDGYYTTMFSGSVKATSATILEEKDGVSLHFNAVACVSYKGCEGTRSCTQVDMMHNTGSIGDIFYLPRMKEPSSTGGRDFEYILKRGGLHIVSCSDHMSPASGNDIDLFYDSADTPDNLVRDNKTGLWIKDTDIDVVDHVRVVTPLEGKDRRKLSELTFSDFKKIDTTITPDSVTLVVSGAAAIEFTADSCAKYSLKESLFNFDKTIFVPFSAFKNNTAQLTFTMKGIAPNCESFSLGSEEFTLTLTRIDKNSLPVISLNKNTNGAQYLQYGFYRVRVNTLFAKQLVARANKGLNAVLSMETQLLEEPKLGDGSYVEIVFERYNKDKHGDGSYKLYLIDREKHTDNPHHKMICASGTVSPQEETKVRIFVPYTSDNNGENKIYIGVQYSHADHTSVYEQLQSFTYNVTGKTFIADNNNLNKTPGLSSRIMNSDEPMDFSGANALYFWEMFYYVPMMVFKRLLSEGKFTEASQWLKYIWNPGGYLVNGQPAPWVWNVRPLEEETTMHTDPLDSVDPDAVAQADPLHYKIATFMSYLDLLIARGDAAYRRFERDALNEAKMWYVQALDVLGNERCQDQADSVNWISPSLSCAAKTPKLFLPQQNEKLAGYRQTLAQRLYNLRNNLSIDGRPLSLPTYAALAAPATLHSAVVMGAQNRNDQLKTELPPYRFPVMLESARSMVVQLMQFGSALLSISERQDAEALSELLQTHGAELVRQSIALQNNTISEIDADKLALEASLRGAQSRLKSYTTLYDEDVSVGEKKAMDLVLVASTLPTTAIAAYTIAAGLDAVPNIYGLAFGGSRYGSISRAVGYGIEIAAGASRTAAEHLSQSEIYRRRRQEWEIQRNAAQSEVEQIKAQLSALAVRRQGAVLQKTYLETQQSQTQAQMSFLKNKFTCKTLYSWLRGKLTAIYCQFYDLAISRCLMAQKAYQWMLGNEVSFIRSGTWQSTYAGLMAGETLLLNLAQMEQSYLEKGQREKEVTRTVCLSEFYAKLPSDAFTLAEEMANLINAGKDNVGPSGNRLSVSEDEQLQATLTLADLNIEDDYPSSLGNIRRIKQISVTLPAQVGPYQDVRAVLSYDGNVSLPRGCSATAVSHGLNDSGQFQLDFNDSRWLPFEGIPVDDSGSLTLSFPHAKSSQKDLLLSLTDIILHIRYTIINTAS
ncbi:toxin [Salmonella enterica]|nr:toxin [Salmonella enterica subsp. enterica]EKY7109947.1 toxin [Salmonella enterica]